MASAAYERRNARARALGYDSYYHYRVSGNGRIPPGGQRLRGAALRRARGHASAADLVADARAGTLVTAQPDAFSRRPDGTYGRVTVTLIGEDGLERDYVLQGSALKSKRLKKFVRDLERAGVVFSPLVYADVRQLVQQ